ncbi:MAG: tannase/feruloyl esterase family alpha/beta hydrolase [Alphaproteobacteria bacterium]|nr:tannase/feruloyl esterase family alpha/beta hydrolase [Alphaproteobacteria bacterium]
MAQIHRRLAAALVAAAGLATAAPAQPGSNASCAALADLKLDAARITAAEHVVPGWKIPPSLFNSFAGAATEARTSFCRVTLTIETEIKVEVWLPDIWNGRFEGVGNGGFTGALNYPEMSRAVTAGFATASTDTGHVTPKGFFDTDWIAGHPERVENFAYRGHHLMAVTAKKIVAAYYGTPARKAYFTGCSSGGWQGLSEAQRYPQDYDGIVAGAPANNFVRLQSRAFVEAYWSRRDPKGDIPNAKLTLLAKAMVAQCVAEQSVKDDFITDPRLCKFDYRAVQCKAGDKPDCLTKAQIARAKKLYDPKPAEGGVKLYPGMPLGAFAIGPIEYPHDHDPFDTVMMIQVLKEKPSWRTATFDPGRDIPPLEAELGAMLDATNPDLAAFKARGGKLVLYHGWADNVLSPYNTLDYFHAVAQKTPGADDFVRLFMIPSMGHCGGGDGPNSFDSTSAIVDWVEYDHAPETLIGFHVAQEGTIGMTRLLCAEPKVAFYKGSGSPDDAANFICKKPK